MTHTCRLVLTGIATAAAVAACSPRSAPPTPSSTAPTYIGAPIDSRDPDRVCQAFGEAIHRIDTTRDAGPTDAYRRATVFMDAALAATVNRQPSVPPGSQWRRWAAHRAYTEVRAGPYAGDALPEPTDTDLYHAAVITVQPVGRDGWRGPTEHHIVMCRLRPTETGWRVNAYETE